MQLGDDKTDIMTFDDGFAFLGEDFGPKYPPAMPLQRVQEPENRVLYLGLQTAYLRIYNGRLIVENREKNSWNDEKKVAVKMMGSPPYFSISPADMLAASLRLDPWPYQPEFDHGRCAMA